MTKQDAGFAALWAKAHAAGMAAGRAVVPTPMTLVETDIAGRQIGREYHVAEGMCGFAYVTFPGNGAFGRWAKAQHLARPNYPTGLRISVQEFNQSIERKAAYAYAACKVLREAGIPRVHFDSRLD